MNYRKRKKNGLQVIERVRICSGAITESSGKRLGN